MDDSFDKEFNDDIELDYDMSDVSFTHVILDLYDAVSELERLLAIRGYLKELDTNEQINELIVNLNSDIKCRYFNIIDSVTSVKFELIHRSENYLDGTWSSNISIHKTMLVDYLSPN